MVSEQIKPRLKLIAKRDFEIVRNKYQIISEASKQLIHSADPFDVLALTVVPGSGLKILDVKILNEKNEAVFLRLLKEGIPERI
jgi:hypothetical protein